MNNSEYDHFSTGIQNLITGKLTRESAISFYIVSMSLTCLSKSPLQHHDVTI